MGMAWVANSLWMPTPLYRYSYDTYGTPYPFQILPTNFQAWSIITPQIWAETPVRRARSQVWVSGCHWVSWGCARSASS